MPCTHCARALTEPGYDGYGNHCRSCNARRVAHSSPYRESARLNIITTAYREMLDAADIAPHWASAHREVRSWAAVLDSMPPAANPSASAAVAQATAPATVPGPSAP